MTRFRPVILAILCLIYASSLWAATTITFVQLADPQLGMSTKGFQQDKATFQHVVTQINTLKPDIVLLCGDLLNNWTPEGATDLATCLKDFTMPWALAPGNHDDWKSASFTQFFTSDRRIIEKANAVFITVNTNLWQKDQVKAGDEQLTWLESALQAAQTKKQTIIIIGHHPVFVTAIDEADSYDNIPLARRAQVLALYEKYHITAYLSGHLQHNLEGYYHGILFVSNASSVLNFSADKVGFRVWRLAESGYLTQEYVPLSVQ